MTRHHAMRVLHFYRTYFPDTVGGIEQVINQLARGTAAMGIHTEVLSLTKDRQPETIELDGHFAHSARLDFQIASTGFSASAFSRFAHLAAKADVIHYHYPWPFMDLVHLATRVRKPSVVTYHSDIIRQKHLFRLYKPLKQRFLASVDRIVATSPNYVMTSQVLSRYRDKTIVIPIGLDKASYPEPSPELIGQWRTRVGDRFFLFVGMIRYYKGLHILLDAVRGTSFPVVIVGAGPVEDELKAQARRLGLSHVHFLGALPEADKVALLKLCHALAFPSHLRSEAFGVSLLEGAMYGKPLISSEIGTGTSYINVHGKTGLVVPPNDPDALRAAMQTLWDDPALAHRMGMNGEARYWELFTARQMASQYAALYEEVVNRRRLVA
jgi:glycosyltransferase involved in cell wall biosynthesis